MNRTRIYLRILILVCVISICFSQINACAQDDDLFFREQVARGKTYIDTGMYGKAINYYKNLEISYPHSAIIQYCLGFTYFRKNDLENAEKYLKKTVDFDPYFMEAYFYLAVISHLKEDHEKTIEYLNTVTTIDNSFYSAHFNKGVTYHKLKKPVEAVKEFAYALYLEPHNRDAFEGIIQAYSGISEEKRNVAAETIGGESVLKKEDARDILSSPSKKNSNPVTGLIFSVGDSKEKISSDEDGMYVLNAKKEKMSEVELIIDGALNLKDRMLKFQLKSDVEIPIIEIKIKDGRTRSTPKIFMGRSDNDWKTFIINPTEDLYAQVDQETLKHIKIYFSGKESDENNIIYIKDFSVI